MCGICGFTGTTNKEILKKMADTIVHRGPDEEGFHSDGLINLGIRRLSIVDLQTGQQPQANEDGTIWTVFNGEIYNYRDLRRDLMAAGHRFSSHHSDTEVIVHLYEDLGVDFPLKLNGMFALALWDRAQGKLLLVRDRMGVKPLFYALINGHLLFASEIKAILAHPDVRRQPNYEALYHYFSFKNVPSPLTAFNGIRSLGPGEMISFSAGTIERKKWWTIPFASQPPGAEEVLQNKVLEFLEDATKLRMKCDVPFGAYLSGGVDSSAIVALMSTLSDRPIKTFSLGYHDELANKEADLYYARQVAARYHTEHYEYIMGAAELKEEIENIIGAFDQPFSGTISTYFLTKLIKQHVKVALSGDGADELFGSYLSHRTAQPLYHYSRLHQQAEAGTLSAEEKKLFIPCEEQYLQELYRKSHGDEVRWRYLLYLFTDQEKEELLGPEFADFARRQITYHLVQSNFSGLSGRDPLNRILHMEWQTQLPDQVLAFADSLSMAHSVELRSPFLDWRLVEFVTALPGDLKIKGATVKYLLKKAVAELLPAGIVDRPKEGFVLPIFHWMMHSLRDYTYEVLAPERLKKHNVLSRDKVRELVARYHQGERNCAGKVWNLMMFQLWWEKYFG